MTESACPDPIKLLRAELKEWEKAYATAHGGQKASREDIKSDPIIATKYREYNKLTGRVAPRDSVPSNEYGSLKSSKRRRDEIENEDSSNKPEKRTRQWHISEFDPYDVPLQRTPSAIRTHVGPTPQKNGQVLGLFDAFSPVNTPSRRRANSLHFTDTSRTSLLTGCDDNQPMTNVTPSKPLATPSQRRVQGRQIDWNTPSTQRFHGKDSSGSGRSRHEETPAFLRRVSLRLPEPHRDVDNEHEDHLNLSPVAVRLPPRPAGKGLSALIKGLRYMEEGRLDEELDLLREVEAEESGGLSLPKMPAILVEDSQILEPSDLPLGADGEGMESHEDEPERADEAGRRPWKKRGQKRTTRKVNIAPSLVKRKPEPEWIDSEGQIKQDANAKEKDAEKGATRRKINATAHANFRALKIRNKNSKGKGSAGFRGRRR